MKTFITRRILIMAALFLAVASAHAVILTNIYTFSATTPDDSNPSSIVITNSDGSSPNSLVLSGNTLYGASFEGGTNGEGAIFRVNTDGTHFTNLFNFPSALSNTVAPDGSGPNPGLLLSSNTLYGTTYTDGGTNGLGTVFKINTDGANFATLHIFHVVDGQEPMSGLLLSGSNLYGTTTLGGSNGWGTVYRISTDGSVFTNIYSFPSQVNPYGSLALYSNLLFGFGWYGGISNDGVIYCADTNGFLLTNIFNFTGTNGIAPWGTPVLSGNTLYGTAYSGGTNGSGTVFRVNTDGGSFTNIYDFSPPNRENTDGAYPYDFTGLVLSGDKIYGTTSSSGSGGQGTVFRMNTDGGGFTNLYDFNYSDGANPEPLLLSDGTLYGATISGGANGSGEVFALILAPTLNIQLINNAVVLSWNEPSFSLYTAPTINGVFTNISGATSPYTNAITASQQFFELR